MIVLQWLLSFTLGFLVDALWVFYTNDAVKKRKIRASLISMAIASVGMIGWLNALDDRELFVPYVLGLGVGTYVAMVIEERRK